MQCVSNGVCFCSVSIGCLGQASHWVIRPAFFVCMYRKNSAIQHNFQVPKRWIGWGDVHNLGVLALFVRGGGGGCMGTTVMQTDTNNAWVLFNRCL